MTLRPCRFAPSIGQVLGLAPLLLALANGIAASGIAASGTAPLPGPLVRVPAASGRRGSLPVVAGIPLPPGIDPSRHRIAVAGLGGRELPAATRAAFPGGRSRWVHVRFVGEAGARYRTRILPRGRDRPPSTPAARIQPLSGGPGFRVEMPPLAFTLAPSTGPFPVDLTFRGRDVLPRRGMIEGRLLLDGRVHAMSPDRPRLLRLESSDPSGARFLVEGRFRAGRGDPPEAPGPRYRLRITALAGANALRLDLEIGPVGGTGEGGTLELLVEPPLAGRIRGIVSGGGGPRLLTARSAPLRRISGPEDHPGPPSASPHAWCAVEGRALRLALAYPWFQERFPKVLAVEPGGRIRLTLHRGDAGRGGGTARRHTIFLFPLGAGTPWSDPGIPGPVAALAAPEWLARFGVEGIPPPPAAGGRELDRLARLALAAAVEEQRDPRARGEWNFGDWPLGDGFGNLEYDTSFGFLLALYRTGDPRWLRAARVGVLHWVDVDRGHVEGTQGPAGLPRVHGPGHGTRVEPGHVWVEGVLHAFYLTGDPFLGEAFRETASALEGLASRRPDLLRARERNVAWTLMALGAAWEATGEGRYLAGMRAAGEAALEALDPATGIPRFDPRPGAGGGGGGDPGPVFRVSPAVSAGILVPGLARLERADPSPGRRGAIVRLLRWILAEALDPELPGIRASLLVGANDGTVLRRGGMYRGDWAAFAARGFAVGRRLSGDRELGRAGRRLLRDALWTLRHEGLPPDGRGRSRLLLNAPAALDLLRP